MNKILFIAPLLKYPYTGGPEMSVHNAIKALNQISQLHIVSNVSLANMGGNEALQYYQNLCSSFNFTPKAHLENINNGKNYIKKFINYFSKNEINNFKSNLEYIIDYYKKNKIDICWFDRHEYIYDLILNLKKARPDIKVVCDTAAIHSRFILREIPYQKDSLRKKEI